MIVLITEVYVEEESSWLCDSSKASPALQAAIQRALSDWKLDAKMENPWTDGLLGPNGKLVEDGGARVSTPIFVDAEITLS